MRVYKLSYKYNGEPYSEWHASEREAVKARMQLVKTGVIRRRTDASIDIIEVPTRKDDLLIWLNANVWSS